MAAPPTASQLRDNALWDHINYWTRYRDEAPMTLGEIRDIYRSRDFIRIPIAPDPTLLGNLVAYPGGFPPPPPAVPNAVQQAWLNQTPTGLPNGGQYWNGTRLLFGNDDKSIGLWEYQPPAGVASTQRAAVVVKEDIGEQAVKRTYDLRNEHAYMNRLTASQSLHVLRSPYPPLLYGDEPRPDAVRAIFLEYCPMGDLWDLIALRRNTRRQFDTLTVWKFFECLVDGACAMHFGTELVRDAAADDDTFIASKENMSLIHFDIKPENIFLTKRDITHNTPVLKYGDFGHCESYTPANRQNATNEWKRNRNNWRRWGTPLYFTPEQFSKEWDFKDFESSPIAGKYRSDKTSIFGIGLLMYQIVTLAEFPPTTLVGLPPIGPKIRGPFFPSYQLNGQQAKGNTYGPDIRAYRNMYSQTLTDLISECLYENPDHRPTLPKLKYEIIKAYKAVQEVDDRINPEAWEHFLPQPPVAPIVLTALRATRKRARGKGTVDIPNNFNRPGTINMQCAAILLDGFQCKRKIRTVPTANPRCGICVRDYLIRTVDYWRAYRGQNPATAFLDETPENLPTTNQYWKGTKFIDGGNNVRLGVWEYQPPAGVEDRKKKFTKLVVKELKEPSDELDHDDDYLRRLQYPVSAHILKILCQSEVYGGGAPDPEFEDNVKRVFLEYCPHGDLFDLINLRQFSKRRFDLLTLWKMFECLVDGVCAMHCGIDPIIPDTLEDEDVFLLGKEDEWKNIIHFDIKPDNILIGDRDGKHNTPVLKFGDFGKSEQYGPTEKADMSDEMKFNREEWRKNGTETYFAPEQFSEEWDYLGWETSEIAGNYSSDKTNIFGVGILMYMLATLQDEGLTGPKAKPFFPIDWINGSPPQGITYGPDLAAYNRIYSKPLTDLIYERLYENSSIADSKIVEFRKHRPDLQRLKYETSNAIDVLQKNNVEPEAWKHFIPEPPIAPMVQGAAAGQMPGQTVAQLIAQVAGAQPAGAQQVGVQAQQVAAQVPQSGPAQPAGGQIAAAVQAAQAPAVPMGPPVIPTANIAARKRSRTDTTYAKAPGDFWPPAVRLMYCGGLWNNGVQQGEKEIIILCCKFTILPHSPRYVKANLPYQRSNLVMATPLEERQQLRDKVNEWRKYRGEPKATLAEIRDHYRRHDYIVVPPALDLDLPEPTIFDPHDPPYVHKPPKAPDAAKKAWLKKSLPSLPNAGKGWKGIKMLGSGAEGIVGLWQWVTPKNFQGEEPNIQKVAVKQMVPEESYGYALLNEAAILNKLKMARSSHVVRCVYDADEIDFEEEGIQEHAKAYKGALRRIFLEYCELGSLQMLLNLRMETQVKFEEITLWLMLNCLVDGMCAMEYGGELALDLQRNTYTPVPKLPRWKSIVHLDIKPNNILLGSRENNHIATPVLKFGDFGASEYWPPEGNAALKRQKTENFRDVGTEGYLLPEQYSKEWEYKNWAQSKIASKFSYKSNVWGVGICMYHLITLQDDPPDHPDGPQPFLPPFQLNEGAPKGYTFAPNLRAYSDQNLYSVELVDLIYECMYQTPSDRPNLHDLKRRIRLRIRAALDGGGKPEDWETFLPEPPLALNHAKPAAKGGKGEKRRKI
ncbi:uncharacterized protein PAC_04955 [Phialocephala subalpina]|uniref:Protein kinase domain-containing protein n=1 Tax=Phialocephala subalpina TaxID=576137 RepID=A0A1L7WQM7_9HELO|nr:uncharacterized protein PAC_04955 [Phialocephala subalpina]